MNIIYLAAYFYPEKYSSNNIYNAILEELVKTNTVHVITPQPTRGVSTTEYCNYNSDEMINGVIIHRFPMVRESSKTIQRFLRYKKCASYYMKIATQLGKIDCIFAASTPPTMGFVAGKLAKKLGVPFIYSLQDIFPDSLVTTGLITEQRGVMWRIGRFIENRIYKKCSHIIAISDDFKKNLVKKGVPERRITVIRNFVDLEFCKPVARKDNRLFDEFGLDRNKFYVTYAGNFGKAQNLEVLLQVACILQGEADIEFILIGDGTEAKSLKELAKNFKLSNLHFYPMQPNNRIAEVYSFGDASVVICRKGSGTSAMPSKTWSIMACAAPVIASFDENTDMERIIIDSKCGVFVKSDDPQALADAINILSKNKRLIVEMGKCGKKYIAENISQTVGVSKYISVITSSVTADM
ncbi:MAG: glycosyltransferase family 4 protein [Clostridiales bacterium]